MMTFLEDFKSAAAEGAVVELKMRLVAGKIPSLRERAHKKHLEDIEDELSAHFADDLSPEEKKTLRLCRQLRNKVLHTDFRAARGKLNELGIETPSGGVREITVKEMTPEGILSQLLAGIAGTEGTLVSKTSSTDEIGVFAWYMEAANAGDFKKASDAFRRATEIMDRLAAIDAPSSVGTSSK
jgi:hypothetical protein